MAGRRWFCEFAVPGAAALMCGGLVCGKRERSRECAGDKTRRKVGFGAKSGELGHAAHCRLAPGSPRFSYLHSQANPICFVSMPAQHPAQPNTVIVSQACSQQTPTT